MSSRAYTKEESVDFIMNHIATLAQYWASLDKTKLEIVNGVVFSILAMLDGASVELPAVNLSFDPHCDDKDYHIERDENWFDTNVINDDVQLHEIWMKYQK